MVRIAFVNPPNRNEPAKHVPMGIAMLAAVAKRWGAEVAVFDVNLDKAEIEELREEMHHILKEQGGRWDIIAFSGMVTTYKWQKAAARVLKPDFPDTLLISGGGCASALHEQLLDWVPEIDALAIGEGENTLLEMLELAKDGELWDKLHEVKGIICRDDMHEVGNIPEKPNKRKRAWTAIQQGRRLHLDQRITAPARPLMTSEELDELPRPAWEFFALDNYLDPKGRLMPGYFTNSSLNLSMSAIGARRRVDVIGERGCYGRCRFCSHNCMGGDFIREDHIDYFETIKSKNTETGEISHQLLPLIRFFSPEWVVDAIHHALIKYKIDFVAFMDETMLASNERTYELCDLLDERELTGSFNWGCLGRVENVDPGLLNRIKNAGCTYISYGYETSNPGQLIYLEKGNTVEQQQKALTMTLESGINPITTYMMGYPGETMQSLYDSARFWVKNGIETMPFFITPYPYTRIYWEEKDKILAQWGSEEAFVEACGDATQFTVNLTDRFTDAELLGLRQLMSMHDLNALRKHSEWRVKMGLDKPEELIVDPDPPKSERGRPFSEDLMGGVAV